MVALGGVTEMRIPQVSFSYAQDDRELFISALRKEVKDIEMKAPKYQVYSVIYLINLIANSYDKALSVWGVDVLRNIENIRIRLDRVSEKSPENVMLSLEFQLAVTFLRKLCCIS
jgi:hypothetical protein